MAETCERQARSDCLARSGVLPNGFLGRLEAERRQVTVLFTDMVGFTSFSERSGEEAALHVHAKSVEADGRSGTRRGGVVRGFTRDGIRCAGCVRGRAASACRSALNILQRLKAAGPRPRSEPRRAQHGPSGSREGRS